MTKTEADDLTLVVLKGHLQLEHSVNHLLEALLPNPKAIKRVKLHFLQKLHLIRALMPVKISVVDAAEKLNVLRNTLAHHLDHPQIETQVKDFCSLVEHHNPEAETEPLVSRLEPAIAFICVMFDPALCGAVYALRRSGHIQP